MAYIGIVAVRAHALSAKNQLAFSYKNIKYPAIKGLNEFDGIATLGQYFSWRKSLHRALKIIAALRPPYFFIDRND